MFGVQGGAAGSDSFKDISAANEGVIRSTSGRLKKGFSISEIQEFVPSVPLSTKTEANGIQSVDLEAHSDSMSSASKSRSTRHENSNMNGGDSASTMTAYNDGGTMYFYPGDEMDPASISEPAEQEEEVISFLAPNFSMYAGCPSYVASLRVNLHNTPSSVSDSELKLELLRLQHICLSQASPSVQQQLPNEVDGLANLFPLEPAASLNPLTKQYTLGYPTTVYRATHGKGGTFVCIRRVQNFKLVNSKCMGLVERWKKLSHSNLVSLRQVFTTKSFGDHSMIFTYDYYPGAETLMSKHFTAPSFNRPMDPYSITGDLGTGHSFSDNSSAYRPQPFKQQYHHRLKQPHHHGGFVSSIDNSAHTEFLPEAQIWTYVVQLASAIRHIHQAGLACRTLDPSKVLVINRSRLLLNCCGIFDVLTFDPTTSNSTATVAHYQQEDLIALGKIILSLACNSTLAIQRENLQTSMEIVTSTYSGDLRNLIMYLLTNPNRLKSVNDLMPIIGGRFFDVLNETYSRMDAIEADLSKEVENSRLLRLLTKLCSIVDRAELGGDINWSEFGDRYMLKLFRDYIFHQVTDEGAPWLDMAHIICCLNKLDVGVSDRICLMSRDEQNVLVVSFAELKQCLESSFSELVQMATNIAG